MKAIRTLIVLSLLFFSVNVFGQSDFTGKKICIDPGHGGHESDDRGPFDGFWESESNLTKGLWLRDLLEARGAEVFITRTGNDGVLDDPSLSERRDLANANNVDIFISIHSNAGNPHSFPMTIFNGKTNTPTIPEAKVWAQILWEEFLTRESTHYTTNGYIIGDLTLHTDWTCGYGVLCGNITPSIISEGSMHDYGPEQHRLLSLDYRRAEAYNILFALEEYFEFETRESLGIIAGVVRDSMIVNKQYSSSYDMDHYLPPMRGMVELLETGEKYYVDSTEMDPLAEVLEAGFYMFDSLVPGTYHLAFSAPGYNTDTIETIVTADNFAYENYWLRIDKTIAPEILSYGPDISEPVSCVEPVRIEFNRPMSPASVDSAFSISPNTEGSISWDDKQQNMEFHPRVPYEVNTTYTVILDTTAAQSWGVYLMDSLEFSFTTDDRNRYIFESSFPADGQEVNALLRFRLIFDSPLYSSSLVNAVTILSDDGTEIFTKSGDVSDLEGKGYYSFIAKEELQPNSHYTLRLKGSIKDEGGIPLVDSVDIEFTTRAMPGEGALLSGFEDITNWQINPAGTENLDPTSLIYKWTRASVEGSSSMLLRYKFTGEEAKAVITIASPLAVSDVMTDSLYMWTWGDLSGNYVSLGLEDGSLLRLDTLDYLGWDYNYVKLPAISPVRDIILERAPGGGRLGDIYFDALTQPGTVGIKRPVALSDIAVYPNPVDGRDIFFKGLPEGKLAYSIYSITGVKLQEGTIEDSSSLELNNVVRKQAIIILRIDYVSGHASLLLQIE